VYTIEQLIERVRNENPDVPALQDFTFECRCCGEPHRGLSDLSHADPAPYRWATDEESEQFQLSSDLCRNNATGDCFVRGVLPIPIIGTDAVFTYGVWSSLSEENFQTYVQTWDEDQGKLSSWFGWFSSALNGYPKTMKLKVQVHPQPNGKRPIFELEATDHPLAVEQYEGITTDRLLEIYGANGHGPLAEQPVGASPTSPKSWWPFGRKK
jgi:hypothetical protein